MYPYPDTEYASSTLDMSVSADTTMDLDHFISGDGIRTTVGTCSYYETFGYQWMSYFLIWAATNQTLVQI
jgi:hypothetical protein